MRKNLFLSALVIFTISACQHQRYAPTSITGSKTQITATYDKNPDGEMAQFVNKYKLQLDMEMGQVIGVSAQEMATGRPQSLLTNLSSDVMLAFERNQNKECDLALMNVHGHRAGLPKGNITVGNIFEIYSFDNMLTVVKLKGSDLWEIFESYAKLGGSGISYTAELVIKDRKLLSATVGGKPIDTDKIYTIVTLDYLADGNDGMEALKKAISVEPTGITLRDCMIDYVKQQTKEGKEISSKLDSRIIID